VAGRLRTIVVHTATALDTQAFTGSGALPLHRAIAVENLLQLHHQITLRQLQRYQARQISPLIRTNPKALSTSVHNV
jgi:hypothetical protein